MQSYDNSPKRYSHIIWDWNGTLLDDAWLCVEVMSEMLREHNLPVVDLDTYREIFDFPVKTYYKKLGFDFEKVSFEIVGMDFMIRYNKRQEECRLHSQVPEILSILKEKGYSQYILSAREQEELETEVRMMGLASFFTGIYGTGDHYAHGKTARGFELISDIGVPPKDCLFIGDTIHDSDVATEIGFDCILIPNGHHHHSRLISCGYPIADSLSDIFKFL